MLKNKTGMIYDYLMLIVSNVYPDEGKHNVWQLLQVFSTLLVTDTPDYYPWHRKVDRDNWSSWSNTLGINFIDKILWEEYYISCIFKRN